MHKQVMMVEVFSERVRVEVTPFCAKEDQVTCIPSTQSSQTPCVPLVDIVRRLEAADGTDCD